MDAEPSFLFVKAESLDYPSYDTNFETECNTQGEQAAVTEQNPNQVRFYSSKQKFLCRLCKFSSYSKQAIEDHIRIHEKEKLYHEYYKCSECTKWIRNEINLKKHFQTHISKEGGAGGRRQATNPLEGVDEPAIQIDRTVVESVLLRNVTNEENTVRENSPSESDTDQNGDRSISRATAIVRQNVANERQQDCVDVGQHTSETSTSQPNTSNKEKLPNEIVQDNTVSHSSQKDASLSNAVSGKDLEHQSQPKNSPSDVQTNAKKRKKGSISSTTVDAGASPKKSADQRAPPPNVIVDTGSINEKQQDKAGVGKTPNKNINRHILRSSAINDESPSNETVENSSKCRSKGSESGIDKGDTAGTDGSLPSSVNETPSECLNRPNNSRSETQTTKKKKESSIQDASGSSNKASVAAAPQPNTTNEGNLGHKVQQTVSNLEVQTITRPRRSTSSKLDDKDASGSSNKSSDAPVVPPKTTNEDEVGRKNRGSISISDVQQIAKQKRSTSCKSTDKDASGVPNKTADAATLPPKATNDDDSGRKNRRSISIPDVQPIEKQKRSTSCKSIDKDVSGSSNKTIDVPDIPPKATNEEDLSRKNRQSISISDVEPITKQKRSTSCKLTDKDVNGSPNKTTDVPATPPKVNENDTDRKKLRNVSKPDMQPITKQKASTSRKSIDKNLSESSSKSGPPDSCTNSNKRTAAKKRISFSLNTVDRDLGENSKKVTNGQLGKNKKATSLTDSVDYSVLYGLKDCSVRLNRIDLSSIGNQTVKLNHEKPYACDHCPQKFKQKAALEKHLLAHTIEKRFSCDFCPAKYHRDSHLRKHMQTHYKPKSKSKRHSKAARRTGHESKSNDSVDSMASIDTSIEVDPQEKGTPVDNAESNEVLPSSQAAKNEQNTKIALEQINEPRLPTVTTKQPLKYRRKRKHYQKKGQNRPKLHRCEICSTRWTSISKLNRHLQSHRKIGRLEQSTMSVPDSQDKANEVDDARSAGDVPPTQVGDEKDEQKVEATSNESPNELPLSTEIDEKTKDSKLVRKNSLEGDSKLKPKPNSSERRPSQWLLKSKPKRLSKEQKPKEIESEQANASNQQNLTNTVGTAESKNEEKTPPTEDKVAESKVAEAKVIEKGDKVAFPQAKGDNKLAHLAVDSNKKLQNHDRIPPTKLNGLTQPHLEKLFECTVCSKKFFWERSLERHMEMHSQSETKKSAFTCANISCGAEFKSKHDLDEHILTFHSVKDSTKNTSECTIEQPLVSEPGPKTLQPIEQPQQQHKDKKLKVKVQVQRPNLPKKPVFEQSLDSVHAPNVHKFQTNTVCGQCSKILPNAYALKLHLLTHRPFACDQCDKTFISKPFLNRHKLKHTGITISCSLCPKKFFWMNHLTGHMTRAHSGKNYECTKCSEKFVQKTALDDHLKTHEERQKHECTKCSEAFTEQSMLDEHLKTHKRKRGRPPGKSILRKHSNGGEQIPEQDEQNGPRKFQCGQCTEQFSTEARLTQHLAKHNDKRSCKICEKQFPDMSTLKLHMEDTHSTEKQMECHDPLDDIPLAKRIKLQSDESQAVKQPRCEICFQEFSTQQGLNSHKRSRHKQG